MAKRLPACWRKGVIIDGMVINLNQARVGTLEQLRAWAPDKPGAPLGMKRRDSLLEILGAAQPRIAVAFELDGDRQR